MNSHSRSRWRGSSDARRLVEQQHGGAGEQPDGDVDPLRLPPESLPISSSARSPSAV